MEDVPSVPSVPGQGNTATCPGNAKYKYCFTINNYTNEEVENLKEFCAKCAKIYIVGDEKGEKCETPHLQGYINLLKKDRITGLKKHACFKRAHIECCKGSEQDNIKYCSKENVLFTNIKFPRKVKIITELFPWQKTIEEKLTLENNDRSVLWLGDFEGCNGKSQFMKYMIATYGCIFCCGGKRNDLLNLCYNQKEYLESADPAIIIWDLPRDIDDNYISYETIECLKNGIIVNLKYETGGFIINSPNILILSNKMPLLNKLTSDRWEIYTIENRQLVSPSPRASLSKGEREARGDGEDECQGHIVVAHEREESA